MGANEKREATYGGGCTPTTEQIRNEFIDFQPGPGICSWDEGSARRFDRWLEQVRAEAKAEALNEAADALDKSPQPARIGLPLMLRADWLRARAEQVRGRS